MNGIEWNDEWNGMEWNNGIEWIRLNGMNHGIEWNRME